jgi:hypothetical protein
MVLAELNRSRDRNEVFRQMDLIKGHYHRDPTQHRLATFCILNLPFTLEIRHLL